MSDDSATPHHSERTHGRGRERGRGNSSGRGRGRGRGRGFASHGKRERPAVPAAKLNEQNHSFWKQRRRAMVILSKKKSPLVEYAGFAKEDIQAAAEAAEAINVAGKQSQRNGGDLDGSTAVNTNPPIDYSRYDKVSVKRSGLNAQKVSPIEAFNEIRSRCPAQVWSNLQRMGYQQPTPVQKHAVPFAFEGHDVMCCAETGSGKTCAFLLPAIAMIIRVQEEDNKRREKAQKQKRKKKGGKKQYTMVKDGNYLQNGAQAAGNTDAFSGGSVAALTGGSSIWDPQLSSSAVSGAGLDDNIGGAGVLSAGTVAAWQKKMEASLGDCASRRNESAEVIASKGNAKPGNSDSTGNEQNLQSHCEHESSFRAESQHSQLPLAVYHARAKRPPAPVVLVLAPTRELAQQIAIECQKLCHRTTLRTLCLYGGGKLGGQLHKLAFGCEVLVATPGRLADFLSRGIISLSRVKSMVLDEADRMLDLGFEGQIRHIIASSDLPPKAQRRNAMFSATFPNRVQQLASAFLRDYVWIAVGKVGAAAKSIKQRLFCTPADMPPQAKFKLLFDALRRVKGRTLVFTRTKAEAVQVHNVLAMPLSEGGFGDASAQLIHADRNQAQRQRALAKFSASRKQGETTKTQARILVATDVAARGLDVPAVEHVVNFSLPKNFTTYVHRIGRTGRAGASGIATSFYTPGFAPHSGNGKMAPLLLQSLRDANQKVPKWFAALREVTHSESAESDYERSGQNGSTKQLSVTEANAGVEGVNEDGTHDVRDATWQQQRRAKNAARDDGIPSTGSFSGKESPAWIGRKHVSETKLIANIIAGVEHPDKPDGATDDPVIISDADPKQKKRKLLEAETAEAAVDEVPDGEDEQPPSKRAHKKKELARKQAAKQKNKNASDHKESQHEEYSAADVARLRDVMRQFDLPEDVITGGDEESDSADDVDHVRPSAASKTTTNPGNHKRTKLPPQKAVSQKQASKPAAPPQAGGQLRARFELLRKKFESMDRQNP